jgi:hypothetical protein
VGNSLWQWGKAETEGSPSKSFFLIIWDTHIALFPFAVYYLRYAVTPFFTISRISLADSKRAGRKVHSKIAAAVQNVKPFYFLSRSFFNSGTFIVILKEKKFCHHINTFYKLEGKLN